jgi:hypothetical protein
MTEYVEGYTFTWNGGTMPEGLHKNTIIFVQDFGARDVEEFKAGEYDWGKSIPQIIRIGQTLPPLPKSVWVKRSNLFMTGSSFSVTQEKALANEWELAGHEVAHYVLSEATND